MSKGTTIELRDVGLLALRLGFGAVMMAHGAQKQFGAFGGHGIQGTGAFFDQIGFKPGELNARIVAASELGGGALLAVGLATPAAGAAAAGTMLVAGSAHRERGFFAQEGGFEYQLVLALVGGALALSRVGPTVARPRHPACLGQAVDAGVRGLAGRPGRGLRRVSTRQGPGRPGSGRGPGRGPAAGVAAGSTAAASRFVRAATTREVVSAHTAEPGGEPVRARADHDAPRTYPDSRWPQSPCGPPRCGHLGAAGLGDR